MKTITLQGEVQKFDNLFQASSNFDEDRLPYEVEIRVYVVDIRNNNYKGVDITDDEFQTLVEEEGRVYTLEGFQEAFQHEEINSTLDVIRFITVPIYE
jgi:hypothetical protein